MSPNSVFSTAPASAKVKVRRNLSKANEMRMACNNVCFQVGRIELKEDWAVVVGYNRHARGVRTWSVPSCQQAFAGWS